MAVVELFGQTLHFPVDGEHQAVYCDGVENSVARRNLINDTDGFAISYSFEDVTNFLFGDGQALQRFRVMLDDQIGNFGLSWIPGWEHALRLEERRPSR